MNRQTKEKQIISSSVCLFGKHSSWDTFIHEVTIISKLHVFSWVEEVHQWIQANKERQGWGDRTLLEVKQAKRKTCQLSNPPSSSSSHMWGKYDSLSR